MDAQDKQNVKNSIVPSSIMSQPASETVASIKKIVESGDIDAAYVGIALKKFAKLSELVKKDVALQETIEEATLKYQEGNTKTFNVHGAKITVANRSFWDYSSTTDPVLDKLLEIEKDVKEFIKSRKEELQNKATAWEKKNSPENIVEFGIKSFSVTWEELPKLSWEEGIGDIETNPPSKRLTPQLRYSV